MSEMIERVAEAIAKAMVAENGELEILDINGKNILVVDDYNNRASDCRIIARAAIEAMREPTDAEIDAAYYNEQGDLTHREIKSAWKSVIKATLDDK